jgi:subtilisin-like proprotein convertase family protein
MIKNLFLFICSCSFVSISFSQVIIMGDPDYPETNPIDCNTLGATQFNFQDPGGIGDYPPNFNDTMVFCPDLNTGTKVGLLFTVNAGYEFDVDPSDFIFVYDGPNTSAPLLGVHNSVTDPGGVNHEASWSNTSGCLTVVFQTDGANEGTGWIGNISCGNPFQPFEMHMEAFINGIGPNALNPADTGFVDVCFGDSILFVAKPVFPNNDSIWFTPPDRYGYLVDLKIEDSFPYAQMMRSKVRVSTIPLFTGTGPLQDSVCLGASTVLIGGVTNQDTVGVQIPSGSFNLGGSYAGLTALPDGNGIQHSDTILISGFPNDAEIQSDLDLNQICITMEHSWLGDLEIWLQCPNGSIVELVNSYSGAIGSLPGGNSGGGIFLGDPIDVTTPGTPGVGWEYCFSSVFNDIGPMTENLTNTIIAPIENSPSMDPNNIYEPENAFGNALAGCPVNGEWLVFVQDNIGADDGYIFEWGLFFDPSFFAGLGSYQTTVDTSWWNNDPTIVSGQNDTSIIVQPTSVGTYSYVFNVVDDYGCPYDTTVSFTVTEGPLIFPDTIACDLAFQVSGTESFSGGEWSTLDTAITFSNELNDNPLISSSSGGYFDVSYTDNECNVTVESQIHFPPYLYIEMPDTAVCAGSNYELVPIVTANDLDPGYVPTLNYLWEDGSTDSTLVINNAGTYVFTVLNECVEVSENFTILPNASIPNDTTVCDYSFQINGTSAPNGGFWSSSSSDITITGDVINPTVNASIAGLFELVFTDPTCLSDQSMFVSFPPNYNVIAMDTNVCIGSIVSLSALGIPDATQAGYPIDYDLTWSNGSEGPSITVSEGGDYTVTLNHICGNISDIGTLGLYGCDLEVPNVIVLSSTVGNDEFFVNYNGIDKFNCLILNRWGNLIYEYTDPAASWPGTNKSGKVVDEGTYFYKIEATFEGGQTVQKHGFVVLRY